MFTSVRSFPPNPFGLYDLYGNVSELVSDRYTDYDLSVRTDERADPRPGRCRIRLARDCTASLKDL
jgi:formylglycine-generating enzyme required for sulfatase activity